MYFENNPSIKCLHLSSDNWQGEGEVVVYGKIIDKNDLLLNDSAER